MSSDDRKAAEHRAFAHSVKGAPRAEWELLPTHLAEVAAATASRTGKFGWRAFGEILGGLHDLGKFKPAFQAYIGTGRKSPDSGHSSAGALYALKHLEGIGPILAHAIAGHHAGLQNGVLADGGRLDLAERDGDLDRALAGYAASQADGHVLPTLPDEGGELEPEDEDADAPSGFQIAFLIRMMFSGLIDGDRICTERFYARLEGRQVERGPGATIPQLLTAFDGWMAGQEIAREQAGEASKAVNLRRREILDGARSRAADRRGVFTLTVPTGGGKTLSGLDFALRHAARHGLDRIIVVIPFTSVIEQNAAVYREALGAHGAEVLEHHSAFDQDDLSGERWQGRTKLQLDMENWDARIVVTTAVQFFESLFSNRTSRCRKLHNIVNSVVILDEAQVMPLRLLRPCVAALRELVRNYGCSVVLSTATQPALLDTPGDPHGFPGGFPAGEVTELAPDPPRLFELMRRVTLRQIGEQTDDELAGRLNDTDRALCIVNTRRHARELYGRIAGPGSRHLSTMMHAEHRSRVLAEIKADLKARRPCRVVSTSLIEVGVDVDFPLVMRAETGLDQVAQSAGRLNREGGRARDDSLLLLFRPAPVEGRAGMPKAWLPFVSAAAEAVRHHAGDPFAPDAMRSYFRSLYDRFGKAELDRPGVIRLCEAAAEDHDYPFADIAEAVRLIDSVMKPVIVANDVESARWLAELEDPASPEPLRTITRKLQRYTVGLPERDRGALLAARAARTVRPDAFADQFVALDNPHLYRPDVGLDASDPYFAEASALIF